MILRFLIRTMLLLITIVTFVALCLAALSPYIDPVSFSWFAFLGLGFEWLLLLNLISCVLWLFTHHRARAFFPLTAILISMPSVFNTISFAKTRVPTDAAHHLSILTYNTHQLGEVHSSAAKDNAVLQYIKQTDADIVCLQEFETYKNGAKAPTLQNVKDYLDYPYHYIDYKVYKGNRQYGTAVFSKYPLLEKRTLRYESATNQSDLCLVVVSGDTLCLINNHLQSIRFNKDNLTVSQNVGTEELKEKTKGIIGKMRIAYKYRAPQARFISDEIKSSKYKTIVCGDFNDTPVSYTYRKVSNNMRDCYLEAAPFSLGHTFMHRHLGIRIDYVLCTKEIYATSAIVPHVNYSDHYPLLVELAW